MTDDRSPFERQLSARLEHMAGPQPHVDVDASVRAATTPVPRWRFPRMYSAAKLLVAGAVVAAFGGYLLTAAVDRSDDGNVAGADIVGQSCPEAAALLDARESGTIADPSIVSRVRIEPFGQDSATANGETVDESDGYGRYLYSIDGIPVEADDDRFDGLFSGEVTASLFTPDDAYVDGPIGIANEAGSWSGHASGIGGEDGASIHFELSGSGAYAGCAALLDGGWEGPFSGIVYPASTVTEE